MIELPIAVFDWTVKVRNGEGWVGLLWFCYKMLRNFGWEGGGDMRQFWVGGWRRYEAILGGSVEGVWVT